jgi:hypothetical protein
MTEESTVSKKSKKECLKVETVEEFLARGGKIERIPPKVEEEEEAVVIKPSTLGPPTLYSLDEAQHFFGKKKVVKKKPKTPNFKNINKDILPESLHHLFKEVKVDET